MRLGSIEGVHRRWRGKYGRRSISTATASDRVERNFTAAGPNELWVADISYLRTWEGFLYLAVVVDAFSRKVVGWAMADHLRTELVLDAVGMAITTRKPPVGTVHHTDRLRPVSTRPTSSARRCAPPGCWPRWGGSGRRSTTRWPSRCSPP